MRETMEMIGVNIFLKKFSFISLLIISQLNYERFTSIKYNHYSTLYTIKPSTELIYDLISVSIC